MDFWDVAKLMWRRWYVTVPALLLVAITAVGTGVAVEPDYQVTGHIAVLGPSIQRSDTTAAVTRINPWSGEALADAAAIRMQGKPLADELAAEGFSGEWSAVVTGRLPVVRLEVVAEKPEYAQATMQRLREVIDEEVRSRQEEYNVAPEEQISIVSYDGGETVEPVTGKVKRALMVVVAAGLILTMGLVVAFDAIARRRQSKEEEPAPDAAKATGPPRARYTYGTGKPTADTPGMPMAGRPNGKESAPSSPREDHPMRVQFADRPSPPTSPAPSPPPSRQAPPDPPDDATIVLPLSRLGSLRPQPRGDQEQSTEAGTS